MRTSNIDFSKILKRNISVNSTMQNGNTLNMYNIARQSLKENKSTTSVDLEKFFKSCTNVNANKYYMNCLSLIENSTDDKDRILNIFTEEVVPYIKNLNGLKESVIFSNLDGDTKSKILNCIKENKICDRILSNDKMIKKRFNIENFIDSNRYLPLENIVFESCSMLDTYDNIPSYGKMNIALEELSYYLQKQDVKYDRSKFVKLVTEYFLYRNSDIDKTTKTRYRNVLKENIMISNDDLSDINYFVEDNYFIDYYDVKKMICNFNNDECKDIGKLKADLQNIFEKSPDKVIGELNYLLETLRHLLIIGTFNFENIQDILRYIPTRSIEIKLDPRYIDKLINIYRMELEIVDKQMNLVSGDKYSMLQNYHTCITDCINKLNDYLYCTSDIECRSINKRLKENIRKPEVTSLREFKLFKFDNLIKVAFKIDKLLRKKSVKITSTIRDKAKNIFKVTKDFFKESMDMNDILKLGIVTEDNSIDMCIAIIETGENDIQEMNSLLEALCLDIENRILYEYRDLDVYYTNIGNTFELHLENKNIYLDLNESEEEIKNNAISERDLFYMNNIYTISECLERINNIDIDNILPSCNRLIENSSNIEYIETIIEALSYTDIALYNDILNLKESYNYIYPDNYKDNTELNSIVKEYWEDKEHVEIPLEVQTEALELINELIQEADSKPKKKGVPMEGRINRLKLSMMGMKKNMKDLSSKEKEMCRNMDAAVNTLCRSLKQATVSDRREAIIKGSIIPSFSKLMKTAIALAGVSIVFHPVYAAIAAVIGLITSKILTEREKSLLLDEIDIELKVADKELQMAENSGNMKKYRKILGLQKKLQRERSRIRYGAKVGRDLPDNPTNDY